MTAKVQLCKNLKLLSQIIPPKFNFSMISEGMFDRGNTEGFIRVSHYLLTIYDEKLFKKFVVWPLTDKRSEATYKKEFVALLQVIITRNSDIIFPSNILMSHLILACGTKVIAVLRNLSTLAIRAYLNQSSKVATLLMPTNSSFSKQAKEILIKSIAESTEVIKKIVRMAQEDGKKFEDYACKEISYLQTLERSREKLKASTNDAGIINVQKQLLDESLNGLRQYKHKCLGSITVKILNLVESLKENKEILDSRHLHKIESLKDADWAIKNEDAEQMSDEEAVVKIQLSKFLSAFESLVQDWKIVLGEYKKMNWNAGLMKDIKKSVNDTRECIEACKSLKEKCLFLLGDENVSYYFLPNSSIKSLQISEDMDFPSVLLDTSPKVSFGCRHSKRQFIEKRLDLTPSKRKYKRLFSRYENTKYTPEKRTLELTQKCRKPETNINDMTIPATPTSVQRALKLLRKRVTKTPRNDVYRKLFNTPSAMKSKRFSAFSSTPSAANSKPLMNISGVSCSPIPAPLMESSFVGKMPESPLKI